MFLGIDVGGTFTDGVLYRDGEILKTVKRPTDHKRLEKSIFRVLDDLLTGREGRDISRVVLSTTLVTNLLATGGGDEVALVLIPGPGLNVKDLDYFPNAYIVAGATDFRGRITEPVQLEEIRSLGEDIVDQGISKVAVVGKFSQRNSALEDKVEKILLSHHPHLEIIRGFEVSGQLNFLRRGVTTYYTAKTKGVWQDFARGIERALMDRGVDAPISILKADGGTMPLETSLDHPCETIFSGPAASAMGAFALAMDDKTSVVVDMGGTTTDLALILNGDPLHASKGAIMGGHFSHIQSLAVRSVPLGGDSLVRLQDGEVTLGPDRLGPAACFAGPGPTPTDAVNLLTGGKLGEVSKSKKALEELAQETKISGEDLAQRIVDQVISTLKAHIEDMFKSWEQEPAYKIWELMHQRKVEVDRAVGIGAAAQAFVPALAKELSCQPLVHQYSPVANALGATVSRPTLSLLVHADTQQGTYHLNIDGISGKCPSHYRLEDVKKLAKEELERIAQDRGIGRYAKHYDFFLEEQFNMIRGWSTIGKLYDVGIQIAPGVIDTFEGVMP